jgi:hypothetical protein
MPTCYEAEVSGILERRVENNEGKALKVDIKKSLGSALYPTSQPPAVEQRPQSVALPHLQWY